MSQIYEIPIGTSSAPAPTILGGSATGLSRPYGLRIDNRGQLVVHDTGNRTISRFAGGTNGNVAPLSTIDVSAFSGVGDAPHHCLDAMGDLVLPHDDHADGTGVIGFFPDSDTGSVALARTISGSMTGLMSPDGCVIR
jgi:hypothetical protein